MRDPIRKVYGLLSHPNIHTQWTDCHHILGEFLVKQERHPCESRLGRDYCVDHDYAYVFHQRRVAEDIVREVH